METSPYDFSEEEIREQLHKFGFNHIPDDKLYEFKKDLDVLIRSERSKLATEAQQNMSYTSESTASPDSRASAPQYPYRPQPHKPDDAVRIHVTGVDPSMRRAHVKTTYYQSDEPTTRAPYCQNDERGYPLADARRMAGATYYQGEERLTRSAPTSPTKSVISVTESERERRTIKRKVLRKVNGESIIDESFIESESDESTILRDVRPRTAPLSDAANRPAKRPFTAPSAPVGGRLYFEEPYGKSVIYAMSTQPHERNVRRCDPVSRYHEFKDYWDHKGFPGEKTHRALRLNVRENMMQYEPVVKQKQKTQEVSRYVVPTEKKRMALRWQVRAQLAEGRMPGSGYVSS